MICLICIFSYLFNQLKTLLLFIIKSHGDKPNVSQAITCGRGSVRGGGGSGLGGQGGSE